MIQRGDRVHLAREAVAEALVGNLYGHVAAHPGVAGAVHFAHATRAEGSLDAIGTQLSAWN